jgi:hypothetical protein
LAKTPPPKSIDHPPFFHNLGGRGTKGTTDHADEKFTSAPGQNVQLCMSVVVVVVFVICMHGKEGGDINYKDP